MAMAFWVGLGIFWSPNGSGDEPITSARSGLLDARALITQETFWDNRDVDWFAANIPLFECPDRELQTTWYYRWELITKHLTYGSPNSGYSFTEFIDRPFWSGTYGAISVRPAISSMRCVGSATRFMRETTVVIGCGRGELSRETTVLGSPTRFGRRSRCIRTGILSSICSPICSEIIRAGSSGILCPRSDCSGKPGTTTGWSSTSTAGKRPTFSAVHLAIGRL